ncbi:MAG: hypothetical protein IT320_27450 [Anaerolineae bacterium]|nr:hypothetical protein [Anaerolineae bacterium]
MAEFTRSRGAPMQKGGSVAARTGLPVAGILAGPLTGTAADTSLIAFGAVGLLPLVLIYSYARGARR